MLRKKAQLVVAFGACAHLGGIPGLANFNNKARDLRHRLSGRTRRWTTREDVCPRSIRSVDGHA